MLNILIFHIATGGTATPSVHLLPAGVAVIHYVDPSKKNSSMPSYSSGPFINTPKRKHGNIRTPANLKISHRQM